MKIKKIEYDNVTDGKQIIVTIEGREDILPAFQLNEIVDKQDLISKIKLRFQQIDNEQAAQEDDSVFVNKFNLLRQLEG